MPTPNPINCNPIHGNPGDTAIVDGSGHTFDPAATVSVGGIPAAVTFVDDDHLSIVLPAGNGGVKNVRVTNPDTSFGTTTYEYDGAPCLFDVVPDHGPTGTVVALNASGISPAWRLFITGATVVIDPFGLAIVVSTVVLDDTHLTFVAPSFADGEVDLQVINPDLSGQYFFGGFTYETPPPDPPPPGDADLDPGVGVARSLLLDTDADENELGDLVVQRGNLVLARGLVAVKQSVRTRLLMFQGEWFLNTSEGTPWFQEILVKSPNVNLVRSRIRERILGTPGITELVDLNLDYDSTRRKLSITFKARDDLGQLLTDLVELGS